MIMIGLIIVINVVIIIQYCLNNEHDDTIKSQTAINVSIPITNLEERGKSV